jgi:hypothetical protein
MRNYPRLSLSSSLPAALRQDRGNGKSASDIRSFPEQSEDSIRFSAKGGGTLWVLLSIESICGDGFSAYCHDA